MEERMVSVCGLICSECPAFLAKRGGDEELKRKTAEMWSKIYNSDIKPEDVECDGCAHSGGVHFSHCSECVMRICAAGRGLKNCSMCEEYPCKDLSSFFEMVPEAKKVLDEERIRGMKE